MATTFSCKDEETRRLLGIIAHFLVVYFGHSELSSTETVERFYVNHKHTTDDNTYHHDGPYWVALRIHYLVNLGGNHESFAQWAHENGYRETPAEAILFFNEHYFDKH